MTRKILSRQPSLFSRSKGDQLDSILSVFVAPEFKLLDKLSVRQLRALIGNDILFAKASAPGDADRITGLTRICLDTATDALYISVRGGAFVEVAGGGDIDEAAVNRLIQAAVADFATSAAVTSAVDAERTARTNADAGLQREIDAHESARMAADRTLQSNIDALPVPVSWAREGNDDRIPEAKLFTAARIKALYESVANAFTDAFRNLVNQIPHLEMIVDNLIALTADLRSAAATSKWQNAQASQGTIAVYQGTISESVIRGLSRWTASVTMPAVSPSQSYIIFRIPKDANPGHYRLLNGRGYGSFDASFGNKIHYPAVPQYDYYPIGVTIAPGTGYNQGDTVRLQFYGTVPHSRFIGDVQDAHFDASGYDGTGNLDASTDTIQELADAVDELELGTSDSGVSEARVTTIANARARARYTDDEKTKVASAPTSVQFRAVRDNALQVWKKRGITNLTVTGNGTAVRNVSFGGTDNLFGYAISPSTALALRPASVWFEAAIGRNANDDGTVHIQVIRKYNAGHTLHNVVTEDALELNAATNLVELNGITQRADEDDYSILLTTTGFEATTQITLSGMELELREMPAEQQSPPDVLELPRPKVGQMVHLKQTWQDTQDSNKEYTAGTYRCFTLAGGWERVEIAREGHGRRGFVVIDAVADIPDNPVKGDEVRIGTTISSGVPSIFKGRTGATESTLTAGNQYVFDGTNWLKIGDGQASAGSGVNEARAREIAGEVTANWAEAGDASEMPVAKLPAIPESKIPASIARDSELPDVSGLLNQSQVDARVQAGVADWAETDDTSKIPSSKLPAVSGTADTKWDLLEVPDNTDGVAFSDTAVARAGGSWSHGGGSGTDGLVIYRYQDLHGKLLRWKTPGDSTMVLADLSNINNNTDRQAVNGTEILVANTGTHPISFVIGGIGSVFPTARATILPGTVVEIILLASEDGTAFPDGKLFNLIVSPHDEVEQGLVITGTSAPSSDQGNTNDIYLRVRSTTDFEVLQKNSAGTWVARFRTNSLATASAVSALTARVKTLEDSTNADTHYKLTKINSVADIPTTGRVVGDVIRVATAINVSVPSTIKGRDGTTTDAALEVGDEYRWDGTNWLKIGDGIGGGGSSAEAMQLWRVRHGSDITLSDTRSVTQALPLPGTSIGGVSGSAGDRAKARNNALNVKLSMEIVRSSSEDGRMHIELYGLRGEPIDVWYPIEANSSKFEYAVVVDDIHNAITTRFAIRDFSSATITIRNLEVTVEEVEKRTLGRRTKDIPAIPILDDMVRLTESDTVDGKTYAAGLYNVFDESKGYEKAKISREPYVVVAPTLTGRSSDVVLPENWKDWRVINITVKNIDTISYPIETELFTKSSNVGNGGSWGIVLNDSRPLTFQFNPDTRKIKYDVSNFLSIVLED